MKYRPIYRSHDPSTIELRGTAAIATDEIPTCSTCSAPMKLVCSVQREAAQLVVYQCQNDPGMCDDWSSEDGGNAVLVRTPAVAVSGQSSFARLGVEELDLDEMVALLERDQECIGLTGDGPIWIQEDETPDCDCGRAMDFVLQLDENADPDFNFGGGGCSYLFECVQCKKGKFCWQC